MRMIRFYTVIMCIALLVTFSSTSLKALDLSWNQIATASPKPAERTFTGGIYDPVRDQFVVFAGGQLGLSLVNNTIWSLDCVTDTWTDITPSGGDAPAPRASAVTVYDPIAERMIVFSGNNLTTSYNDLWEFDLITHTWSEIIPLNTPPSPRTTSCGIFDTQENRILIFGGFKDGIFLPEDLDELWEFSFYTLEWTNITPSGSKPSPRSYSSAIYDSKHHRMVIFGGYEGALIGYTEFHDTWSYEISSDIFVDRTSSTVNPPDLSDHSAVYDGLTERMIIFGGGAVMGFDFKNAVWSLNLNDFTWIEESVMGTLPEGRSSMASVWDTRQRRMLIFGGHKGTLITITVLDETWELTVAPPPVIPAQNTLALIICVFALGCIITACIPGKLGQLL